MNMGSPANPTQDTVAALEAELAACREELAQIRTEEKSRSSDLALLGRYGNLLLGCTDLAEALQTSEQMLSQLLPDYACTIYPLIDGEGLAEATHLWGDHVVETTPQASASECLCMGSKRVQRGNSSNTANLCAHFHLNGSEPDFATACIPLVAQGDSLGWISLTAPVPPGIAKLQVAIAAADQLALALANLKLRHSLRDLSVRDPLTGLFNRRYLAESLGRELARSQRRNLQVAVMTFDLDHFKAFNDNYGHAAGDAVLEAFARMLQSNSRNEDIACRQGGEEFVLIMPEMALDVAERRAQEMMHTLASISIVHEGQALPSITTSIGIAIFPDHGKSADRLLAQADQALYRAKSLGRNRAEIATTDIAPD
jgi:diguanylate cyclase (GGDEF)-like protein